MRFLGDDDIWLWLLLEVVGINCTMVLSWGVLSSDLMIPNAILVPTGQKL